MMVILPQCAKVNILGLIRYGFLQLYHVHITKHIAKEKGIVYMVIKKGSC